MHPNTDEAWTSCQTYRRSSHLHGNRFDLSMIPYSASVITHQVSNKYIKNRRLNHYYPATGHAKLASAFQTCLRW